MPTKRVPVTSWIEVDTTTKTAALVFRIVAAGGEGDVEVFRQDVTNRLTADDKRRLRDVFAVGD